MLKLNYILIFILCVFLYSLALTIKMKSTSKSQVNRALLTQQSTSLMSPPQKIFVFSDDINSHIDRNSEMNPTYEIRFYTPAQAADYVEQNCSLISTAYNILIPLAYKSDLFRYCVLWNEEEYTWTMTLN